MPGPATFRTELRVAPDGKIKMVFAPPGLIQAIWLQLAFAMCADCQTLPLRTLWHPVCSWRRVGVTHRNSAQTPARLRRSKRGKRTDEGSNSRTLSRPLGHRARDPRPVDGRAKAQVALFRRVQAGSPSRMLPSHNRDRRRLICVAIKDFSCGVPRKVALTRRTVHRTPHL
jgi:hypothetical protein